MERLDPPYLYYCGLCLSLVFLINVSKKHRRRVRLPPGPWQLPVIGSLHHLLRGTPHRTMRDLSLRHGPLMLLRVCERAITVVSSAEAVREIFKRHDAALLDRLRSPGVDELSRHGQGVILAPYGDHWRFIRRILMEEAARLVSSLQAACGGLVDMNEQLGEFMTDAAVRAIFGDRLPDRTEFLRMVKQGVSLTSLLDLRDLFPSSRLVRLLPMGAKAERHRRLMFRLMDNIIKARQDNVNGEHDMVDVLLRIQQEEGNRGSTLTHGVIRAVLIVSASLTRFVFFFRF